MTKKWTEEDEKYLIANWNKSNEELAVYFQVSPKAVQGKRNRIREKFAKETKGIEFLEPVLEKVGSERKSEGAVAAFGKAYELMMRGEFERASKAFADVVIRFPNEITIANRAKFYSRYLGSKTSEKPVEVETAPIHPLYRAIDEFEQRDYPKAFEDFEKALAELQNCEIYYNRGEIFYYMACCKSQLGEPEEAIEFLKKAFAEDPDLKRFSKDDVDFNPIKNNEKFQELFLDSSCL